MDTGKYIRQIERLAGRRDGTDERMRDILIAGIREFTKEHTASDDERILPPQSALEVCGLDLMGADGSPCGIAAISREGIVIEDRASLVQTAYPPEDADTDVLMELFTVLDWTEHSLKRRTLTERRDGGTVHYCNRRMEADIPETAKGVSEDLEALVRKHGSLYRPDCYALDTSGFCTDSGARLNGSAVGRITWDAGALTIFGSGDTGDGIAAFRPRAVREFCNGLRRHLEGTCD